MGRGARVGVGLLTGERNRGARLARRHAPGSLPLSALALVGVESSMRCIHANLPLSLCLACLLRPLPGHGMAARLVGGGKRRRVGASPPRQLTLWRCTPRPECWAG